MQKIGSLDRDTWINDLEYNEVNFDDFRLALLLNFQCLTIEGWVKIMENYEDTSGSLVSVIFFFSFISLASFVLMNFVVAVLFDNFSNKDKGMSDLATFKKLQKYVNKLDVSDRLKDQFYDDSFSIESKKSQNYLGNIINSILHPKRMINAIHIPNNKYYDSVFTRVARIIVENILFDVLVIIIQQANIIILLEDRYRANEEDQSTLADNEYISSLFIGLFCLEVCLRNLAYRNEEYIKKKFNVFDILILMLTIFEIAFPEELRMVTFIRQIRIFRVSFFWLTLECIRQALNEVYIYIIIQIFFIFTFALIGMQLFAGDLNPDFRNNFDNFANSLQTVIKIIVGDNWNEIMYTVMHKTSAFSSIYFVLLIITCNFVMTSILLAVIIESFISTRAITFKIIA